MKKFTFTLLVALMAITAYAAGPKKAFAGQLFAPAQPSVQLSEQTVAKQAPKGLAIKAAKSHLAKMRAPKKAAAAADLVGDYTWEYLTTSDQPSLDLESLTTTAGSSRVSIALGESGPQVVQTTAAFNFNAMDVAVSSGSGESYVADGDITETLELTAEDVALAISPAAEGKTATRFWGSDNGPQLRCYGNTLTFSVPEGKTIAAIVFNYNGKYWGGNNNGGKVTADSGELKDDATLHAATWTGEAQSVVFTIEANTQLNSINVTYSETAEAPVEEKIIISGMFPNSLEATITSEDGLDLIVIEAGQVAGTSQYGDYVANGMFYYGGDDNNEAGWYYSDIYGIIGQDGVITIDNWIVRILSGGQYDGYSLNPVWVEGGTLTPAEPLTLVEVPAGVAMEDYVMVYSGSDGNEASVPMKVAVDGSDVYFQGMSYYLPEAWVKGVKDGNLVTFPAMQYVGDYGSYGASYAFYNGDAVFTYDPQAETYTAEGQIFGVLGERYYDGNYINPVLKKVVEQAAMPANPAISSLANGEYGWYISFNVPAVDVDGNGLVTSKLSYIFYTDVEGEVAPLTFTSATHEKLTADLTEIPFGFTEGWDFYDTQIFLNDLYSAAWNKIGIKSIYRGGGEENATEIQWFDIKDYAEPTTGVDVTFDFNALPENWPVSNSGNDGDITEDTDIVEGAVTLTVSPSTTSTPNRYWKTNNGIQLRVYGGTLTFAVPEGEEPITKITFNNGKWSDDNSADSGEFDGNVWTGEAQKVVVTIAANTQLNSIDVQLGEEDVPVIPEELVELPAGVQPETWTLEGTYYTSQGSYGQQFATEVAFDGNDVYVKGLAYYFEDAWIKGTIADGIATFPTGQFVGEDEYGPEYILGADKEDNICDIEFAYDAEAQTLTQLTYSIYENSKKDEVSPYGVWDGVILYAGEPIVLDPVVAPADLATETYLFKATSLEYTENEEGEETQNFVEYTNQVQVGFDGDDLYIQGLSADCPELWVKATKNEAGQYVIPANQFMGTYDVAGLGMYLFDYFFTAVDEEGNLTDVVLNFDAESNTFTTDQVLALNGSKNKLYYYLLFMDVTISKLVEFAATPADPAVVDYTLNSSYPNVRFDIPAKDVDGNDLLGSKLFYTIWIEKDGKEQPLTLAASLYDALDEDMTEIPYTFGDNYDIYATGYRVYLNQSADEIATWTKIGVQSIYYGGGEVNKSNIVWSDELTTAIAGIAADGQNAVYFDLQGRRVAQPGKGLYIMNGKKVVVK